MDEESGKSSGGSHVYVATRIRPLNASELEDEAKDVWNFSTSALKNVSTNKTFTYDSVFGPTATSSEVYRDVAENVVSRALEGYNGTLFSYGQTGSGKTYSMLGEKGNPGILPLALEGVFKGLESTKHTLEYDIKCSYLEVYNEQINDLLVPAETSYWEYESIPNTWIAFSEDLMRQLDGGYQSNKDKIEIKHDEQDSIIGATTGVFTVNFKEMTESSKGYTRRIRKSDAGKNLDIVAELPERGAIIGKLKEVAIRSESEGLGLLRDGEVNRKYGSTNMNVKSSRSHSIFRVIIECRVPILGDTDSVAGEWSSIRKMATSPGNTTSDRNKSRISYLNLVDLAGSERQTKSGTSGVTLKEGSLINKSLLTLNACISALSKGTKEHIPYRDSKLTRILKQSLGGNSVTAVLCTISPASIHVDETVSTLNFGAACKRIANRVTRNEVKDQSTLLREYKLQIEKLQSQIESLQSSDPTGEKEKARLELEETKTFLEDVISKKDASLRVEMEARINFEEQTKKLEKKLSLLQEIVTPKSMKSKDEVSSFFDSSSSNSSTFHVETSTVNRRKNRASVIITKSDALETLFYSGHSMEDDRKMEHEDTLVPFFVSPKGNSSETSRHASSASRRVLMRSNTSTDEVVSSILQKSSSFNGTKGTRHAKKNSIVAPDATSDEYQMIFKNNAGKALPDYEDHESSDDEGGEEDNSTTHKPVHNDEISETRSEKSLSSDSIDTSTRGHGSVSSTTTTSVRDRLAGTLRIQLQELAVELEKVKASNKEHKQTIINLDLEKTQIVDSLQKEIESLKKEKNTCEGQLADEIATSKKYQTMFESQVKLLEDHFSRCKAVPVVSSTSKGSLDELSIRERKEAAIEKVTNTQLMTQVEINLSMQKSLEKELENCRDKVSEYERRLYDMDKTAKLQHSEWNEKEIWYQAKMTDLKITLDTLSATEGELRKQLKLLNSRMHTDGDDSGNAFGIKAKLQMLGEKEKMLEEKITSLDHLKDSSHNSLNQIHEKYSARIIELERMLIQSELKEQTSEQTLREKEDKIRILKESVKSLYASSGKMTIKNKDESRASTPKIKSSISTSPTTSEVPNHQAKSNKRAGTDPPVNVNKGSHSVKNTSAKQGEAHVTLTRRHSGVNHKESSKWPQGFEGHFHAPPSSLATSSKVNLTVDTSVKSRNRLTASSTSSSRGRSYSPPASTRMASTAGTDRKRLVVERVDIEERKIGSPVTSRGMKSSTSSSRSTVVNNSLKKKLWVEIDGTSLSSDHHSLTISASGAAAFSVPKGVLKEAYFSL